MCVRRHNQSHQFRGVFPASPLLLITIDLGVTVYTLFLSLVCHHLHMVVFCINSYVVYICVCNISKVLSQANHNAKRYVLDAFHPCPPGAAEYRLYLTCLSNINIV